ncbi:MAG TPA: divalent metal cation transporter [Candidatus Dormibacteraeota bacterium]|jgi:NRAMP (natural resistance-associated macrophage protein)-like metal ion transporter|nr:divalent metal cation transporter [Candidatus Dormibacteraeota bacterium]
MGGSVSTFAAVDLADSAVVDPAHLGDIRGAWGRLPVRELAARTSWRGRLAAFAVVAGPGLLTMVADNDAGSIATFSQAGQNHGTRLLWILVLLLPVLIVNQEMAARLGAVSGVGHARLILARFGRLWMALALGDLVVLSLLTLMTEFIGVRLAASVLGIPTRPAVVVCALALLLATSTGSFRRWERMMFVLIAVDVVLLPLGVLGGGAHPQVRDLIIPGIGGRDSDAVLLLLALAGTTLAPWQLFFHQSSVVDKRITPRWLGYERAETAIGAVLTVIGAAVVMIAAAAAFAGTPLAGHFSDAGAVADGLGARLGGVARTLFAIGLLDGALLGGMAVTLGASYACSEVAGARHSLHRTPRTAPFFYGVIAAVVVIAAAVALLPGVTPGTLTVMVQVLAGVLLPSATVLLLLLCNDTQVLGPWVNAPWLNWLASTVVAGLLLLSMLLVVTTVLPELPLAPTSVVLGALTMAGLLTAGVLTGWGRRAWRQADYLDLGGALRLRILGRGDLLVLPRRMRPPSALAQRRRMWRTPPLDELARPPLTRGRTLGMLALRAYLVAAVAVVVVKATLELLGG